MKQIKLPNKLNNVSLYFEMKSNLQFHICTKHYHLPGYNLFCLFYTSGIDLNKWIGGGDEVEKLDIDTDDNNDYTLKIIGIDEL